MGLGRARGGQWSPGTAGGSAAQCRRDAAALGRGCALAAAAAAVAASAAT